MSKYFQPFAIFSCFISMLIVCLRRPPYCSMAADSSRAVREFQSNPHAARCSAPLRMKASCSALTCSRSCRQYLQSGLSPYLQIPACPSDIHKLWYAPKGTSVASRASHSLCLPSGAFLVIITDDTFPYNQRLPSCFIDKKTFCGYTYHVIIGSK